MKSFTVLKKNQGFSLIELMIVVAIIGVLSAIAIPNFQNFIAKSKQSEAKAHLSGIYTAEKAFHAEWTQYTGDLVAIGFRPDGNLRYESGFTADPGLPATYTGTPSGILTVAPNCGTANFPDCQADATVQAYGVPGGGAALQTFVAGARGNIDSDATLDDWTIDQGKSLANPNPDLEL